MKKKLFSLLLCLALILSVGMVAYAAAGGFTMTYLPGTADTVSNMPANDSGEGGQPYTVSDKIPQREGYEFLGWTLDYGVEDPRTSYVVRYVDRTTGADIAEPKVVEDQKVGDTAEETAVESDNYDLDDDDIKSLPLQAENNEIIFYYKPAIANYIVRYVDVTYGDFVDIIEPEIGTGNVGSKITKSYNRTFSDYCFIGSKTRISIILTRNDENNVIIFEYTRLM